MRGPFLHETDMPRNVRLEFAMRVKADMDHSLPITSIHQPTEPGYVRPSVVDRCSVLSHESASASV